jgi:hypothetical protein
LKNSEFYAAVQRLDQLPLQEEALVQILGDQSLVALKYKCDSFPQGPLANVDIQYLSILHELITGAPSALSHDQFLSAITDTSQAPRPVTESLSLRFEPVDSGVLSPHSIIAIAWCSKQGKPKPSFEEIMHPSSSDGFHRSSSHSSRQAVDRHFSASQRAL